MAGLIDKLRAKAQETLQDPQKMEALKSKVGAAVSRRLSGGSQRATYYPGINPGMPGYGYDYAENENDTTMGEPFAPTDEGDWTGSPDSSGWSDSPDAGWGSDAGGGFDSGGDSNN